MADERFTSPPATSEQPAAGRRQPWAWGALGAAAVAFVAVVYGLLAPGLPASGGSGRQATATAAANPPGAQVPQAARQPGQGSAAESDTTVYITRTGHCYHRAGCQYLKRSCIPVSLEEADRLGKVPCSVCRPPAPGQQQ
jgi:hypothetical protein